MEKYVLIEETGFEIARKKIRNNKKSGNKIIFSSDNDELNRRILEKEHVDILLLNQKNRKDKQKQRDSGLNNVTAKIAKKNNIIVGVNFDEIIILMGKEKSEIIARVKQNIKLCNKNKIKMKFIILDKKNERDIYDLNALGLVLGMPTWMTKELQGICIC